MGIAIVGVGGVARYAHIPSYKRLGLQIEALCDIDASVAREVADEAGIAVHTTCVTAATSAENVDVVDLATPPSTHAAILEEIAPLKKPILIQKPLCTRVADFERILALRKKGVRVRLNCTGRAVSAWRKIKRIIDSGELGIPVFCSIHNSDWWDRTPGRWDHQIDDYIIFEMVIHHLDLCLFWFGRPLSISGRGGCHPGQQMKKTNYASVLLDYGNGFSVQIIDDWTMSEFAFATGHPYERIMITGDRGVVRGTSEAVDFSERGSSNMQSWRLPRPGQTLATPGLDIDWFPNSFGASMMAFQESLPDATAFDTDWDHLEDLTRLTFAAAEALHSDRWIKIAY